MEKLSMSFTITFWLGGHLPLESKMAAAQDLNSTYIITFVLNTKTDHGGMYKYILTAMNTNLRVKLVRVKSPTNV